MIGKRYFAGGFTKDDMVNSFEFGLGHFVNSLMDDDFIDYQIGDKVMSKTEQKELGTCTGFRHNNTCVDIDGKCWGGKVYFQKSEWTEFEVIE